MHEDGDAKRVRGGSTLADAVKPSNWGRWGRDDERGAANFITPDILVRAAGLIQKGKVYNLSLPLSAGAAPVWEGRHPPVHLMASDSGDHEEGGDCAGRFKYADDYIALFTHTGTHIDALAHVWYGDKLYNGFAAQTMRSKGAHHCGIDKLGSLVGRGVLIDLAGWRGLDHLPANTVIQPSDLTECAVAQNVRLEEGDILLVRTGWLSVFASQGAAAFFESAPGLGRAAGEWVGEKRFAAVGSDNFAVECHPPDGGGSLGPVHKRVIRDFGCYLIEMVVLDGLARDKVYEFFFAASPLSIPNGVGSPINPIAIC
jgi:kynurenine formamidase